jgi:hypothetical protein
MELHARSIDTLATSPEREEIERMLDGMYRRVKNRIRYAPLHWLAAALVASAAVLWSTFGTS